MWQEAVVQLSGLEWVVVRPAIMTNAPRTSCYKAVTDLAGFSASKISRADVAEFLLNQITDERFLGKLPVLSY